MMTRSAKRVDFVFTPSMQLRIYAIRKKLAQPFAMMSPCTTKFTQARKARHQY